ADRLPNQRSGGRPGKGCTTNADCGTGRTCVNDTGRYTDAGAACTSDSGCTAPATCETGACVGGANAGNICRPRPANRPCAPTTTSTVPVTTTSTGAVSRVGEAQLHP